LTRDEYREVIRMEIYGELMREEFSKGLAISDEEIAKYYEAHKDDPDQQRPETVTASHILIAARPNVISQQLESEKHLSGDALLAAVRAEIERRRKLAAELRSKAAAGANFAALARQSSEDPSSRDRGGDLGTFRRNTHHRVFDEAAFALKPGSVSTVVQTDFGFHIIKVSAHDQARPMTLVESTSAIHQRLLTQRQAGRLTEWLKEARRTADVKISQPFLTGALKTEFPPK
jgi:parvulin-like peptidyl-prolyl isomerase